jgi:hypothetical protein
MADIRLELPSYSENAHYGWEGNRDLPDISQHQRTAPGYRPEDDPSLASPAYWVQYQRWMPVEAVLSGTAGLRALEQLLPQLEHETPAAYSRRCARGVLTPFFQRIVKAAVGLILRKPITLSGGDPLWWEEWRQDVNRHNSSLEEFCGKVLFDAIAYGHNGWLVDHQADPGVVTLQDQLSSTVKPYFVRYETGNVIGWREAAGGAGGHLAQLRLREVVHESWGKFGQELHRQVRVLEPGKWATYRVVKGRDGREERWALHEEGETGLEAIPYVAVYSQREGLLQSRPPLLEIANLNLQHYALQAQLLNCLHVAAQPVMVVKGWDQTSDRLDVGVNNALQLPTNGDAFYVEPASSAFDALQKELQSLEQQMANLGIAILARQKNVAESGIAKQLDRADSHSMLAVISQDLEAALQRGVNWVAEFAGVEPPVVAIDRDFNADPIDAQTIDALGRLFVEGAIDQRTLLELLRRGEVFGDDFDPQQVLALSEAQELESSSDGFTFADPAPAVAEAGVREVLPPADG